jgi:hypothetical protein
VTTQTYLTTREVAEHHGVAVWQARLVIDSLGVEIPRAGLYRLVPVGMLGQVGLELQRRGYLPRKEAARA